MKRTEKPEVCRYLGQGFVHLHVFRNTVKLMFFVLFLV